MLLDLGCWHGQSSLKSRKSLFGSSTMKKVLFVLGVILPILLVSVTDAFSATFTLHIQTNGAGTVTRNPTNSFYPEGSVVTLTARPSTNWLFSHWSGDGSGTANPLNVPMNSNKSITANFQMLPTYRLDTSAMGEGSISLSPSGPDYMSNTLVSVTAVPSSNWIFLAWSGDASGTLNPVSIRMNSAKAVTATFVEPARIVEHPSDISAPFGSTAGFGAEVAGSGSLGFQWLFNGAPIQNANLRNYIITNVQAQHIGSYRLVVTNAYGTATSNPARLLPENTSGSNVVVDCTEAGLRWAIARGGTVTLQCNGTILLTNTIVITNNVILDGTNFSPTISGGGTVRLFQVEPSASFVARHITFADGYFLGAQGSDASGGPGGAAQGGAFYNGGALVLENCVLTNNTVKGGLPGVAAQTWGTGGSGQGGAIYNSGGFVFVTNSVLIGNLALGSDARPLFGGTLNTLSGAAFGGAIYSSNGQVGVVNTLFQENAGRGGWAGDSFGGAVFLFGGSTRILSSTLRRNTIETLRNDGGAAQHCGGGAIYLGTGELELADSILTGNSALGGSGLRQALGGQGNGGGIYSQGNLNMVRCTVEGNRGTTGGGGTSNHGRGGGIFNNGNAIVNQSSIYSNLVIGGQGGGGGGTFNQSGNGYGGGIFNGGRLSMTNSTLSHNTASGGGAGTSNPAGTAFGGGIFNSNNATLAFVTIADNRALLPGAGGDNIANESGTLSLRGSIVAYGGQASNSFGSITDLGYNISSDGSCAFSSGASFNFTDPRLEPLADNGGPTLTRMLRPNSPAANLAPAAGAPAIDQRGVARPSNQAADAGAVELGVPFISFQFLHHTRTLRIQFPAAASFTYYIESSDDRFMWSIYEVIQPASTIRDIVLDIPLGERIQFFRVKRMFESAE